MIHPAVRNLLLDLGKHPAYQELLRRVSGGGSASLSGLTTTAKALYSVLLAQSCGRPLILVADGNRQAEALAEAVQTFFGLLSADDRFGPQLLPAPDVLPLQNLSPHAEICEQRAIGLWRLATQKVPLTILPVTSAMLRIDRAGFYQQLALRLKVGEELPLDEVVAHLESIGYERREPVEMVGEYSVRGGILDVYSPEAQKPVRIDLFGDLVESIRRFDVESQRSVLKIEECTLLPLTEYQRSTPVLTQLGLLLRDADLPGRDLPPPGEPFPGWEMLAPMVSPRQGSVLGLVDRPVVLWDEPEQVRSAAERLWKRLLQTEVSRPMTRPASTSVGRSWSGRRNRAPGCRSRSWNWAGHLGRRANNYIYRRGPRGSFTAICGWLLPRRVRWWNPVPGWLFSRLRWARWSGLRTF